MNHRINQPILSPYPSPLAQIVDRVLCGWATPQQIPLPEECLTLPKKLLETVCHTGLTLLCGRPGMGRTSLALNLALCVAKYHGKSVLYFSFVETKEVLTQTLLCMEGLIDTNLIRKGAPDIADWERLHLATRSLKSIPLYLYDDPLTTVGEIAQICRNHSNIGLVILDGLVQLECPPGGWNASKRQRRENRLLRKLSQTAQEQNIPLLCIGPVSRAPEYRSHRIPDICDIRRYRPSFDCMEAVLFLYRDAYYTVSTFKAETAYCYVRMNRNGIQLQISMLWFPAYQTFLDSKSPKAKKFFL